MIEGKIRLLVVEDSKTQALQLKNDLKKHGFEVVLAFDANQALEILENEEFRIIISDVVMPGMDGFEFCKQVKKKFEGKTLSIILLTALNEPEDIIKGLAAGADNFIVKPYDISILISRIEYILANQLIRENNGPELKFEVYFNGKKYTLASHQMQIIDLLLSSYETVMHKNRELERVNKELKNALNEIKQLHGMLPICSYCHKIRDDEGYWHRVEEYIEQHADVSFTHSLCPDCLVELYPEYAEKVKQRRKDKKDNE
ncbi:MAG: response regulator [Caldisericaceae bacterium]|nr:response regulator [Caldisericaceae bacterium]